ncbi:MAG: radical SAM protein [Polyangiaceae bacterium]|nr:radical SAM protein [Polyangiaceae bacterium]
MAYGVLTAALAGERRPEVAQLLAGLVARGAAPWLLVTGAGGLEAAQAQASRTALEACYPEARRVALGWAEARRWYASSEAGQVTGQVSDTDDAAPTSTKGEQVSDADTAEPAWEAVDITRYQAVSAQLAQLLVEEAEVSAGLRYGAGFDRGPVPRGSIVGFPGLTLPVRAGGVGVSLADLARRYQGALRLWVTDDSRCWSASELDAWLRRFEQAREEWVSLTREQQGELWFELPGGVSSEALTAAQFPSGGLASERAQGPSRGLAQVAGAHCQTPKKPVGNDVAGQGTGAPLRIGFRASFAPLRLAPIVRESSEFEAAAEAAKRAGVALEVELPVGAPGDSAEAINQRLALAMDRWDRLRLYPVLIPPDEGAARGVAREVLSDFAWTVDRRLNASSGPEKVIMNLTYACNNHCTFCAVGTRTQFHGHTESQREHLREYRARGVTMVDFDGGEPTLHPDLIGTVRYARQIGYERINVTTNGRLAYYEPFARKLVRSGLTTLLFSVHGPDARSHAQQVGVAEAFEQTTQGIRNCVKFAPEGVELGMNVTLTKSNTVRLEELAQLTWDLGLRWINIQFLTPFGRATRMIAPDTEYAAEVTRGVIDRWRGRLKVQIINLPFCYMKGYEEHLEGDLLKLARHMIFVNNEDVNLAAYLAERRVRKPECEPCSRAVFCGGFYELDTVPEPPWLVAPEDLVKKRAVSVG